VSPPFIPETASIRDTSNVDQDFLQEMPLQSLVEDGELLKKSASTVFDNFSFVNEEAKIAALSSTFDQS
jgi:hypothetical protein